MRLAPRRFSFIVQRPVVLVLLLLTLLICTAFAVHLYFERRGSTGAAAALRPLWEEADLWSEYRLVTDSGHIIANGDVVAPGTLATFQPIHGDADAKAPPLLEITASYALEGPTAVSIEEGPQIETFRSQTSWTARGLPIGTKVRLVRDAKLRLRLDTPGRAVLPHAPLFFTVGPDRRR